MNTRISKRINLVTIKVGKIERMNYSERSRKIKTEIERDKVLPGQETVR